MENVDSVNQRRSVQSDLDLHCPQKPLVSSSVITELRRRTKHLFHRACFNCIPYCLNNGQTQLYGFRIDKLDNEFIIIT